MQVIHYNKTTGAISAWGSGDSEESAFPDCGIVRIDVDCVDMKTQKIDVTSGDLVSRTAAEIAELNKPSVDEINMYVRSELLGTDQYMLPDRASAMTPAWVTYRQALRDLSNNPTVVAMVNAFPVRPDGIDAAADLRARLAPTVNPVTAPTLPART